MSVLILPSGNIALINCEILYPGGRSIMENLKLSFVNYQLLLIRYNIVLTYFKF